MILTYAFSNRWGTNISRRTLSDLGKILPSTSQIIYLPIFFHPRDFYKKYIANNQYSLIIGLGDYYGNLDKIKLETAAHNRYSSQEIYPFSSFRLELSMPNIDIVDPQKFYISENMGTYNCNWIAYKIQLNINTKYPQTKQLFFHLPQKSNSSLLAQDIANLLQINEMLK